MIITLDRADTITTHVVIAPGRLDCNTLSTLTADVATARAQGPTLVDLSRVVFIDLAGVDLLDRLQADGVEVVDPSPAVLLTYDFLRRALGADHQELVDAA